VLAASKPSSNEAEIVEATRNNEADIFNSSANNAIAAHAEASM
jgi:ABC-type phosphate/phosphonate transport system substrate-binding protein